MKMSSNNLILWEYFQKDDDRNRKLAYCNLCYRRFSYKTTITNLKGHLKIKHKAAYQEFMARYNKLSNKIATSSKTVEPTNDGDSEAETSQKLPDVWSYFEQESGRRARCVVCRTIVSSSYDELKDHLHASHPKLLLHIMQDNDNSDAASNEDETENAYTEVVYLEQDPNQEEPIKIKEKSHKPVPKKVPQKRMRRNSSFDEYPRQRKRIDDSDELGAFLQYISCLLKKLPHDAFSQVQVDIINTILRANTSHTNISNSDSPRILNSEVANSSVANVLTVSEITPADSVEHNYTITVAAKPNESQNTS